MRSNSGSGGGEEDESGGGAIRRSGVLLKHELGQEGDAPSIEFLVAFVRHLIRNNPSSDTLFLAVLAASKEVGITQKQANEFVAAVMDEQKKSHWPEGFFA